MLLYFDLADLADLGLVDVSVIFAGTQDAYNGRISKPRTQNWGKNDKMMPKSCPVKARLTKHNLKSKF